MCEPLMKVNVFFNAMKKHSHEFIETYTGMVGFGMDRKTDELTVMYYLQKISDDKLLQELIKRLSHEELENIFDTISQLLKRHLTEPEYHRLFLKDKDIQ
ncbi:MAG: cytoplasmic protein [Desulfobacterales bacterium]|nr:cytoplasmic protein [Desulfobacterales bacterium]MDD4072726.1 cytoplasmic protein [Desulfobacterales bacterium]MDD4392293.1 cytoplasmic protein [Desulfobacterales bacterium]